ncbi:hypothetical protein GCM10010129_52690 [Streptomyces fumigatiscleroticus]|nr:hypothetical protein GCM10010129_52690 [Streptomyces fumigatiscleroticus]
MNGPGGSGAYGEDPENSGYEGREGAGERDSHGERNGDGPGGPRGGDVPGPGPGPAPRIPLPRTSVEDGGAPLPPPTPPANPDSGTAPLILEHRVLKSLLGAWALAACSPEESGAVEDHLGECGPCADEALRLREAVGLLQRPESLDLDPALRTRVLEGCLERRPPRIPVPEWAAPYDAEAARLDALLQDFGDAEWHAPVRLRWFDDEGTRSRRTTVAGVIAHLLSVDGLVAVALGLDDPLGENTARARTPVTRTEAYWNASHFPRCGRPGGSRATHWYGRWPSRAVRTREGWRSPTATSNCRCTTRCSTGPSSAGCTRRTSRRRWTTRTGRPRPVICTA